MKELSSRPRPMPIALPIYPVALRQGVSAEHVDSHSLLDIRDLNNKKTFFWGFEGQFHHRAAKSPLFALWEGHFTYF